MTCTQSCFATKYRPYFVPITIGGNQNFKEIHNFLLTRDFEIIARNAECFASRGILIIQPGDKSGCAQRRSLTEKQTKWIPGFPPIPYQTIVVCQIEPQMLTSTVVQFQFNTLPNYLE